MALPVYLDFNGTTPVHPEVAEAMRPFLTTEFGNPSSTHHFGRAPREAVACARRQVADLLGCTPGQVLFTSGGTESNNHAIKGLALTGRRRGHIITSAVEHPAVLAVCRYLTRFGIETTYLPVDSAGRVAPDQVAAAIRPETLLISIMHANNEVGTLMPIEAIADVARRRAIRLHTDAAQSVGKIPTFVETLGVDLLSLAGHKLYAPKGVGALYVRDGMALENFCHGAGQEGGRRGGTENVALIVGLGKACEIAARNLATQAERLRRLRDRLHQGLASRLFQVHLNGHPQQRLPNTLSLAFEGIAADRLLHAVRDRVAASAGAACHSDRVALSHVLQAMAVEEGRARGTVRFSLGASTTAEEIDRATTAIVEAVQRLAGQT